MDKEYAIKALIEFYKAAQLDGMVDDVKGDDEESIGWMGDMSEMAMTYGTIRQAAIAVDVLQSLPQPPQQGETE